jgi:hypothetical protein
MVEEEENLLITKVALDETCNKGGHPTGSTIEYSQAQHLARIQEVIFFAIEYAACLEERGK